MLAASQGLGDQVMDEQREAGLQTTVRDSLDLGQPGWGGRNPRHSALCISHSESLKKHPVD